jgi:hypothetical protein
MDGDEGEIKRSVVRWSREQVDGGRRGEGRCWLSFGCCALLRQGSKEGIGNQGD